jgi:hypothetical protein
MVMKVRDCPGPLLSVQFRLVRDLDIGFDIVKVDVSKFNMVYT